jgi:hypothetical protein
MAGKENVPSIVYAKKGEHGLLEDHLTKHVYVYYDPVEREVADDFNNLMVLVTTNIKEITANGYVMVSRPKPLEPSVN